MANPTINDVARLAGVSKKTVSRVINDSPLLNEATRARVQQVIAEIGYVPNPQARALARQRGSAASAPAAIPQQSGTAPPSVSATIALVYDSAAMPLLPLLQGGLLAALDGTDHALIVHALGDDDASRAGTLRTFIERHRPAGIVLSPSLSELAALSSLCGELACPCIRLGSDPGDGSADVIASDERSGAAAAVGHLIALGHRRIGMITGPDESRIAQQRELGYLDAMADHDLDRGPALIATGDHTFQSGYAATLLLLEISPRPTAIFTGNDEMAAGAIHAAVQQGLKVPENLSVVGFDDSPLAARLCPQLTTVRVPIAEMAHAAGQRLIGLNADPRPSFLSEIAHRSTMAPPAT